MVRAPSPTFRKDGVMLRPFRTEASRVQPHPIPDLWRVRAIALTGPTSDQIALLRLYLGCCAIAMSADAKSPPTVKEQKALHNPTYLFRTTTKANTAATATYVSG